MGDKRFLNISGVSGLDSLSDGRGAVFADFDNDGDYDVFLTTIQGRAHLLFRNNVGQDRARLRVQLEGTRSGTDGFGAIVRIGTSAGTLAKVKSGGEGYLAQHDPRLLFGLGQDSAAKWLEVQWPSGQKQRFEEMPPASSIKIVEGENRIHSVPETATRLPDPLSERDIMLGKLKVKPGDKFPELNLRGLDGKPWVKPPSSGKYTLVNLWATWCLPCAKEMPELQALQDRKAQKLATLGICLDPEVGESRVRQFLKKRRIHYQNAMAGPDLINQIFSGEEVFIPLSFILDPKGRVIEVFAGWSPKIKARLDQIIP